MAGEHTMCKIFINKACCYVLAAVVIVAIIVIGVTKFPSLTFGGAAITNSTFNDSAIIPASIYTNPRRTLVTADNVVICSDIGKELEVSGSDVNIEVRQYGDDYLMNNVQVKGEKARITSECQGFEKHKIKKYDVRIWGRDVVVRVNGNVFNDTKASVDGNYIEINQI